MNNQVTRQMMVTTPAQAAIVPNQVVEKVAFFDAAGNAVDLAAVLADFEDRIAALEA